MLSLSFLVCMRPEQMCRRIDTPMAVPRTFVFSPPPPKCADYLSVKRCIGRRMSRAMSLHFVIRDNNIGNLSFFFKRIFAVRWTSRSLKLRVVRLVRCSFLSKNCFPKQKAAAVFLTEAAAVETVRPSLRDNASVTMYGMVR